MFSIYFNGNCFQEYESTLYLINAAKSEFTCAKDFINESLKYLIAENEIYEDYKNRHFVESTDDDISLMKSIISNMKKSVVFDFEKIVESHTMNPEYDVEHMMLLTSENNYIMLYWNTTA